MFASITLVGEYQGQQVVNVWWYRDPTASTGFNEQEMVQLLDAYDSQVLGAMQNWSLSSYRMKREIAQGYSSSWARQPFLPTIRDRDTPGVAAGGGAPPYVAAILSARVEPKVGAPRPPGNKRGPITPVTRGYWAFAPVPVSELGADGVIPLSVRQSARYEALRVACAASLSFGTAGRSAEPIVVSKPLPLQVTRGYGTVRQVTWREDSSTRRSRKRGRGA